MKVLCTNWRKMKIKFLQLLTHASSPIAAKNLGIYIFMPIANV